MAALGLVGVLLGGPVGRAAATPTRHLSRRVPARVSSSSLPWSVLGLPAGIDFTGSDEPQSYAVPIPAGLTPTVLSGVLHAPAGFGGGILEVELADGAFLGAVDLPEGTFRRRAVPFRVSLARAPVENGVLSLVLVVRQTTAGTGRCGPPRVVTVTDLAVGLAGVASQPSTIDAFFPGVVRSIAIYVAPRPTPAEEQVVLQLAASLVAHYEPLPVKLAVRSLPRDGDPPDLPATALDRAIVVRQGGSAAITVVPGRSGSASLLTLSGSAETLPVQASLFAARLSALAQVPSATVTQPATPVLQTASVYTLSQLGIDASTTVLGDGSLSFGLDQGLLGGPLSSIVVHLIAEYTPLASEASGTLIVKVGGVVLFTTRLGGSGHLDTRFRIPLALLTRNVSVGFALTYDPVTACSPLTPQLSFSVDPRSTVTVTRLAEAAGGFSALPDAFLNGFDVALQEDNIGELNYATLAVAGLQALTSAPLEPELVSLGQARTAGFGTLVVGDSAAVTRLGLDPPLRGRGERVAAAGHGTLRAEIPDGVGSIQAFADPARNRTVLLVTTTSRWSLVDPLFAYLTAPANGGWGALTGDVLVSGQAADPADLAIRTSGVIAFEPQESTAWRVWLYLGGAALLVVGGIAALRFMIGRRAPEGDDERTGDHG